MYSDWHVYNHQTNKGEAIETGLPRGGSTPPFFDGKRRREAQANQSRTQEPLLAFFSSAEGVTCERKGTNTQASGRANGYAAATLGDLRGSGAPLECVEQPRARRKRPDRQAVAPLRGEVDPKVATTDQLRHRSLAGRTDHRSGAALRLRLEPLALRRGGRQRGGALHGRGTGGQPLF